MIKSAILIIVCSVYLMWSCKPDPCHRTVTIVNNSPAEIVYAKPNGQTSRFECSLLGTTVPAGSSIEDTRRRCLEEDLEQRNEFEFFIIRADSFERELVHCDSIEEKNKILRHEIFTLERLQADGFVIQYP